MKENAYDKTVILLMDEVKLKKKKSRSVFPYSKWYQMWSQAYASYVRIQNDEGKSCWRTEGSLQTLVFPFC